MLTFEQFREGLTESRKNTIDEFIENPEMPQFQSWEQVHRDFARPNDRHAWRVFSRVLESLHPDRVTQDQRSLLYVWERAFKSAGLDLRDPADPVITKRDLFVASKSKDAFREFLDNVISYAGTMQVTLAKRTDVEDDGAGDVDVEDLAAAGLFTHAGDEEPF